MRINQLLHHWGADLPAQTTTMPLGINIPVQDMARLKALSTLYPGESLEQIARDLLSAALAEVEASFPYKRGERIVAEDEMGEPVYEDAGLTPRFLELTRQHLKQLQGPH